MVSDTRKSNDLTNLDIYFLLNIFNQLDNTELLYAAQHPNLQEMLSKHYIIGKLKQINTMSIWIGNDDNISSDAIINDANSLFNNELRSMFQALGGLFTRLRVYNISSSSSLRSMDFLQQINLNCSSSLQEIALYNIDSQVFDEWSTPFQNVTIVNIKKSVLSKYLDLNRIFPQMRRLDIDVNADSSVFNRNFPHLRYMVVRTDGTKILIESHLTNFIDLNPQIYSLHMPLHENQALLQDLNEKLPNLRVLGLEGNRIDLDMDIIHIKNVTKFSWIVRSITNELSGNVGNIPKIAFDQDIESFELFLNFNQLNNIDIEFIVTNYKDLVHLAVKQCQFEYEQLFEIVRSLKKLKVLEFEWQQPSDGNEPTPILTANSNLNKVFIHTSVNGTSSDEISKVFPSEWKFEWENEIGLTKIYSFARAAM